MDNHYKIGLFYSYYPHGEVVDWQAFLQRAASAGVDAVELSAKRLVLQSRQVQRDTAMCAQDLGLVYTFCTALPPNGDVSSADAAQRARGIASIQAQIEMVSRMGGVLLGGQLNTLQTLPHHHALQNRPGRLLRGVESVQEMAKTAADCGVTLGIECCNRFENSLLNTAAEGIHFLTQVDHPCVGLHLDTFHMNIEEDSIHDALLLAKGRLVHLHACENNRKLPGMGHINWQNVLHALREIGYSGMLMMECFSEPFDPLSDAMCLWKRYASDNPDEDVRRAVQYLKNL